MIHNFLSQISLLPIFSHTSDSTRSSVPYMRRSAEAAGLRRGGAWNAHDDAATAGVLAAARAAGARSVAVHYGEVTYGVWLEAAPTGETSELDKRVQELQLATVG